MTQFLGQITFHSREPSTLGLIFLFLLMTEAKASYANTILSGDNQKVQYMCQYNNVFFTKLQSYRAHF